MISSYTIGYGDDSPTKPGTRLACVLFLPFTVGVFGELLTRIASLYMSRKQQQAERQFLNRNLTLCDLKNLDVNEDGTVDLVEFMSYMLVSMQKVEKADLEEIVATFRRLDRDQNGHLDANDIVRFNKRRSMRWSKVQRLISSFEEESNDNSVA